MGYNAKADLYHFVDQFRERNGIPLNAPLNVLSFLSGVSNVDVVHHSFETHGFCGAAFFGPKKSTIVLNQARTEFEQNFDCGHEMIHLGKHREINDGVFKCFESDQNSFYEWEANEGSAQLLVPYQTFIPSFVDCYDKLQKRHDFDLYGCLSDTYQVSPRVIDIRMDSLAYEIDQYRQGVTLENLNILSRTQRKRMGITPTDYRVLCAFPLDWDSEIWW